MQQCLTRPKIQIDGLSKTFGTFTALKPTHLDIPAGEFLTLLGPSGSGKTTLLQMVAGLLEPTSGKLLVDGQDWTARPVNRRGVGLVFQHYALFPHMTVAENVAFPLKMRRIAASEIRQRVEDTLKKVELDRFAHRFPRELSGGQQQRVALARCFVFRPEVILMDEPLGALDKALRENMQLEIRRLHKEFGTTLIYVTHDQEEALVMSDRICVMNHAQVEQLGTPHQIYADPRTIFAATFIGHSNLLRGGLLGEAGDGLHLLDTPAGRVAGRLNARDGGAQQLALVIRPEHLHVGPAPDAEHNEVTATLRDVIYVGAENRLLFVLPDGTELMASDKASRADLPARGQSLSLHWRKDQGRIVS
ncbi:ABC transporter ATP-binding protein [Paracoccus pantotrophus]|nr:ABC transporter ATP-binding protein [Paracoccus pantotrophus]MDF3855824.1 ABC transporter ATP-binding protein [Paracoccus pantotrophus]RNI16260.1 ABC transporter ATP-binding protein [Paracoccus pantotrophus]SFO82510.1 putative spermidine/putrescine transport system ATP-binding protein [Paracoccus pantotrophus]